MHYEDKIDANLALQLVSIQGIKGVAFGAGFEGCKLRGSQFHDPISYKDKRFQRTSNNAGGIEAGMTNGQPLRIHCCMKPISTLPKPLSSVNMKTKKPSTASVERADICAVPAASIVAENVTAIVLAKAVLEKFGRDSLDEIKGSLAGYMKRVKRL